MVIRSDPETKKIIMRSTGYGDLTGKTGPLKCDKGFTARAVLKTPRVGESTWFAEKVYLIDAKVPVWDCDHQIESVWKKEDP